MILMKSPTNQANDLRSVDVSKPESSAGAGLSSETATLDALTAAPEGADSVVFGLLCYMFDL